MNEGSASPCEAFNTYFTVDFASTPELRKRVYEVRYRVYCEEFRYEEREAFSDGQERDKYDAASLHCLITHRPSGRPAGCVRLVPADAGPGIERLPLEEHCGDSLDRAFLDGLNLDRSTVCEISRLAVDGHFRRRAGESSSRYGAASTAFDASPQEQRSFPLISVAAFLAATALTELAGRTNVFAMMEPFLPRMLERSGIRFQRAGADTDYHGIRAPYFVRTQDAVANMRPELTELYQSINTRIRSQFGQGLRAAS